MSSRLTKKSFVSVSGRLVKTPCADCPVFAFSTRRPPTRTVISGAVSVSNRSEEHTSELQSHRDLHSFPTRRSSDLGPLGEDAVRGLSGICVQHAQAADENRHFWSSQREQ